MATADRHARRAARTGWIRPRGRRKAPGRPITYGTTEAFLTHFGLEEVGDLPGSRRTQGRRPARRQSAAGLCRADAVRRLDALRDDEEPLEPGDLDLGLAPPPSRRDGGRCVG